MNDLVNWLYLNGKRVLCGRCVHFVKSDLSCGVLDCSCDCSDLLDFREPYVS